MKQMKIPQFHDQAESVRQQFVQALPVIGFFLLMFYSVIFLFGMEYTMVVSLGTLIFQVNYKKKNTYEQVLLLIPHNLFLLILAYIATWNLPLCLVLNLVVPFWLGIFLQPDDLCVSAAYASRLTRFHDSTGGDDGLHRCGDFGHPILYDIGQKTSWDRNGAKGNGSDGTHYEKIFGRRRVP